MRLSSSRGSLLHHVALSHLFSNMSEEQLQSTEWMHEVTSWPKWTIRSYWDGKTLVILNIISKNGYFIRMDGGIYPMRAKEFDGHEKAYYERYPEDTGS